MSQTSPKLWEARERLQAPLRARDHPVPAARLPRMELLISILEALAVIINGLLVVAKGVVMIQGAVA